MTLTEIGAAVGGRDYAAVSMAIKRFESRLTTDRSLRKTKTMLLAMLNVET
jgi:chromosomal replication initiation ATPase DnaA